MKKNTFEDESKVLVVEDDTKTRELLLAALRAEGFLCSEAGDTERARTIIKKARPDLVILDLGFPGGDGLDFLRELRLEDDIPVIVCTGRAEENDKLIGLEIGADDYITKPFSPKELVMRSKTILRRVANSPVRGKLTFGNINIQLDTREVFKGEELIFLTSREYDLLIFLARNPRIVHSREALLKAVWAQHGDRTMATVTEHIRRLRGKIEDNPDHPKHLCAVRGVGYRLQP